MSARNLVGVLALALSACVTPPARVDTPHTEAPDKSYTVELPVGWIRSVTQQKELIASRDGFSLEAIAISHRKLTRAFPLSKKAAETTLLPSELAELAVAEMKAQGQQLAVLSVQQNEPALISDKEGFKLKVTYKTPRGLDIEHLVYGFADDTGYYTLEYRAPRLYYFQHYFPQFEDTVASFRLVGAK